MDRLQQEEQKSCFACGFFFNIFLKNLAATPPPPPPLCLLRGRGGGKGGKKKGIYGRVNLINQTWETVNNRRNNSIKIKQRRKEDGERCWSFQVWWSDWSRWVAAAAAAAVAAVAAAAASRWNGLLSVLVQMQHLSTWWRTTLTRWMLLIINALSLSLSSSLFAINGGKGNCFSAHSFQKPTRNAAVSSSFFHTVLDNGKIFFFF